MNPGRSHKGARDSQADPVSGVDVVANVLADREGTLKIAPSSHVFDRTSAIDDGDAVGNAADVAGQAIGRAQRLLYGYKTRRCPRGYPARDAFQLARRPADRRLRGGYRRWDNPR